MISSLSALRRSAIALGFAALCASTAPQVAAQTGGISREAMWPAPTAAQWKLPTHIRWQRTFEDALKISKATGKPVLVCANMDGEIASEHYAGVLYRKPEIAKLFNENYVPVIASTYRHNPRDYDEKGQRIPCPRFGCITCGEHITIEPGLHDKFFDGRRIAPRHVGVELDGGEMYDVFYAFDIKSVFEKISVSVKDRPASKPLQHGDLSLLERVLSADSGDRDVIETIYQKSDRKQRRKMIYAAAQGGKDAPVALLRLAISGLDVELARLAREALAKAASPGTIDVIVEALRVPMETAEREALILALERLSATSRRAAMLANVYRGLGKRSKQVDLEGWSKAIASTTKYEPAPSRDDVESTLSHREETSASRPADATVRLELAESSLYFAVTNLDAARRRGHSSKAQRDFEHLVFVDAQRIAHEAEKLGSKGWRLDAALGLSAYYLGQKKEAYARAEAAVGMMPPEVQDWNAIAILSVFAEARHEAIVKAIREKKKWPREWLTDVNAAYTVIAQHPLGTDTQILSHYDFLDALGGKRRASRVLDMGLARFPESSGLHHRLRDRTLAQRGVRGLEEVYGEMLQAENASPSLEWFAGYASIVAAEFHKRRGRNEESAAAYTRALAHYEASIKTNPDNRDSADHYAALALAGRARIAVEAKDYEAALKGLLAAFARRPEAASNLDGLNLSPVDTAKMLRKDLAMAKRENLLKQLQAALDELDPEHLLLPAYEREVPVVNPATEQPKRQGRRDRRNPQQSKQQGSRRIR